MFANYINTFLKYKQEASGPPNSFVAYPSASFSLGELRPKENTIPDS